MSFIILQSFINKSIKTPQITTLKVANRNEVCYSTFRPNKTTEGNTMSQDNIEKTVTLYSQKGSSDKVYMLQMSKVGEDEYMLHYANAKRGAALKMKVKTTTPLSWDAVNKEFDNIIGKKKKGSSKYAESTDDGETLQASENAEKDSGFQPQLLNEIDEATARKLCLDKDWGAMEKKDGERRPLLIENGKAEGTNRYGIYTGGMKTSIAKAIDASVNLIIDTEDMGTKLEAFDMIEIDGKSLRNMGFGKRHQALCDSPTIANSKSISIVPLFVTSEDKLALLERMIAENREGLVFKKLNAPYTPDRPASGGDQLKFKLYSECSVLVTKINVQRSFEMGVFDKDGNQVIVGNCTIPANANIPTVGDVIEVKYLYAYKGGSLYQPSLNKPRPDQRTEECRQSQLKYKPDAAA